MKIYFDKWTIARAIQLVIGIVFISDYLSGNELFSLLFGGVMFIQAVLNIGCFSSKGCNVPTQKDKPDAALLEESSEVDYEVIH